jgi:hypothetical protein
MRRRRQDARERERIKAAAALGLITVESVFHCICGTSWTVPWLQLSDHCERCSQLNISALIADDMEPEDD